jgi:hypothetical protein
VNHIILQYMYDVHEMRKTDFGQHETIQVMRAKAVLQPFCWSGFYATGAPSPQDKIQEAEACFKLVWRRDQCWLVRSHDLLRARFGGTREFVRARHGESVRAALAAVFLR